MSTDGPVRVHVVLPGGDEVRAGTLRFHETRRTASATFTYEQAYLADPRAYALDPTLQLDAGSHQTPPAVAVFGAMSDGAPDRWGRNLMTRAERERAQREGVTARTLIESDFLLGTRDDLRQGALRYTTDDRTFLAPPGDGVPRLIALPRLLDLTDALVTHEAVDRDLRDLVAAGGSLGGARPKAAVVLDDGAALAIAKLPRRGSDEWDVMGWEKVTLDLAVAAQLTVPRSHLVQVLGRNVLITERFDRRRTLRVGFISAMTMLEAHDGDQRSYLEIADTIETQSPAPGRDLEQLFRRIVFSVLVSNTDDHLRNHGFLREPTGWTLSPAFDLNPNPEAPGALSTTIDTDGDPTASIDLALQTAQMYRLSPTRAIEIVDEVEQATAPWRTVATRLELPARELELMLAAFDTPERTTARAIVTQHRTSSTVSPARVGQPQPRRPRGTPAAGQYAPQPRSQPDEQR